MADYRLGENLTQPRGAVCAATRISTIGNNEFTARDQRRKRRPARMS
ncbi:Hypothetical protein ETEE_3104 [Edwardsiella anguillarum ET080813]|uniref:Uncharacterized protein n=1 Tax=Edwardsiella anguillarum ET080813 TaxID=667120 RepID=A0A076LSP1_9GAMM|nr:Hypothetical protein ETEE_3104 [Edwardsiella anguillarum ET080813]